MCNLFECLIEINQQPFTSLPMKTDINAVKKTAITYPKYIKGDAAVRTVGSRSTLVNYLHLEILPVINS